MPAVLFHGGDEKRQVIPSGIGDDRVTAADAKRVDRANQCGDVATLVEQIAPDDEIRRYGKRRLRMAVDGEAWL